MSHRTLFRMAALASMAFAPALLGGCATQQAPDARAGDAKIPWWVAGPSAPLPEGFPSPGPIDKVIIKQYPAYRAAIAETVAAGGTQRASSADGLFYPLFNHIEKNHIAMSSPVEITYGEREASRIPPLESMAFIYTSPTIGAPGPDGPVRVIDVPAMSVASVGIVGEYDEKHFLKGKTMLEAWLKEHAAEYVAAGSARHLAYNSPFIPAFMRYSEVQIPITPAKK